MRLVVVICCVAAMALAQRAAGAEHEFRYKASDAQSVAVMGEFNGWKPMPMTKGSDGTWTAKVSLPAGTHGYKFLINGRDWVFDPANSKRKSVDGVENSSVDVAEGGVAASTPRPLATATPAATPVSALASRTTATPSATPASATSTASLSVKAGETNTIEVPLSAKRRADAAKDGNRKLERAKVAIAVPQDFDPQKPWPVLVVRNTQEYSNIDAMGQFRQAALAEGWVVMAADDVGAENGKEGATGEACTGAAFDYLETAWPGVRQWPVACGGMSGGAKNSGFLAAYLGREGRRIIGILMMGCNEDTPSMALRQGAPPPGFRQTPVFLSSGKADTIATPEHHERVKASLRGSGFRKVRLENFDGAHVVYEPHVSEALRWFAAEASGAATAASPTPRSSELDKFFKTPR